MSYFGQHHSGPTRKRKGLHGDDGKLWTNPYSVSQCLHLLDLGVQGVVVPRADVGLQDYLGADALVGEAHGGVAHDGHDLVPFALDLGEHRGSAVGQPGVADDANGLRHVGGQLVSHAEGGDGNGNKRVHRNLLLFLGLRG